jgi:hypothetical protein
MKMLRISWDYKNFDQKMNCCFTMDWYTEETGENDEKIVKMLKLVWIKLKVLRSLPDLSQFSATEELWSALDCQALGYLELGSLYTEVVMSVKAGHPSVNEFA